MGAVELSFHRLSRVAVTPGMSSWSGSRTIRLAGCWTYREKCAEMAAAAVHVPIPSARSLPPRTWVDVSQPNKPKQSGYGTCGVERLFQLDRLRPGAVSRKATKKLSKNAVENRRKRRATLADTC